MLLAQSEASNGPKTTAISDISIALQAVRAPYEGRLCKRWGTLSGGCEAASAREV